jgi:O-antigen ligase
MQQQQLNTKTIIGYTLAGLVFFLPIKAQVATLFIVLSLILAFLSADWRTYWSRLKTNKFFVTSILYFVLHLIGLIYSDNLKYGFKDIESKLSFLIFPLLFNAFVPVEKQIGFIKKSFIAGCCVALLICIANAFMKYTTYHKTEVFFYSAFSLMMHSTYFSFYLNVALIILLADLYNRYDKDFKAISLLAYLFIEMLLITGVLLLSARMSLIVTVITLGILFMVKAIHYKSKKRLTIIIASTFVAAFFMEIGLSSIFNRFTQLETTIENEKQITTAIADNKATTEEYNSTTSRMALWKYATELITRSSKTFLFGVGTGDIKEELRTVYIKNNFQKGIDENYNPHNQYLHTWVVIGLLGVTMLLLLLLLPLKEAFQNNYLVFALFLLVIGLNALTESILEVQSGIIFFCMMYGLLVAEMRLAPQKNNV